MWQRIGLIAISVSVAAGCGDGGIGGGEDTGIVDTTPEPTDAAADETHSADGSPDTSPDVSAPEDVVGEDVHGDAGTGGDTAADTDGSSPDGLCPALFACNEPLVDGRCEGQCRDVDGTLTCRGKVVGGLCDEPNRDIPPSPLDPIDFGDFTLIPISVPLRASVGETASFEFQIHNDTDRTLDLPFDWRSQGYWAFNDVSWAGATAISVAPGGTEILTASIEALKTNLFDNGQSYIALFNFGEFRWYPRATIDVTEADAIACGRLSFPATWCRNPECNGFGYYNEARCCGDVFYPAAQCCVDADCDGGHCADGRCVAQAPLLGSANTLPVGNQRLVLVLVDTHPEFSDDPCANRVDLLAGPLELDTVDNWFHWVAMTRLGRETLATQWTVLAGIASSDFLVDEDRVWYSYAGRLDAWLADRGCPVLGAYDKVLVSAPTLELWGAGGVYFGDGGIGLVNPYNPLRIAHELAHSFGATDLYTDLAGTYQYSRDLMGNHFSPPPESGDGVAWSEMGFADTDFDGVIDIASYITSPTSIAITEPTAVITASGSLEVSFEVRGFNGDESGRVVLPWLSYAVESNQMIGDLWVKGTRHTVVFDSEQVDMAALEAAGTFGIHITGTYTFTDASWRAQTFTIDEVLAIPVTRAH